jgi:hypothetical protein
MPVLHRYWFALCPGLGIGVTAETAAEARALADDVLERFYPRAVIERVTPDVDLRTLDPRHVLPNVGIPACRGVWFPALNRRS